MIATKHLNSFKKMQIVHIDPHKFISLLEHRSQLQVLQWRVLECFYFASKITVYNSLGHNQNTSVTSQEVFPTHLDFHIKLSS